MNRDEITKLLSEFLNGFEDSGFEDERNDEADALLSLVVKNLTLWIVFKEDEIRGVYMDVDKAKQFVTEFSRSPVSDWEYIPDDEEEPGEQVWQALNETGGHSLWSIEGHQVRQ